MAKRKENPKRTVMRLVRCAYHEASIGNTEHARSLWASAITHGYDPGERGAKGFEMAIAKGIRDTRK